MQREDRPAREAEAERRYKKEAGAYLEKQLQADKEAARIAEAQLAGASRLAPGSYGFGLTGVRETSIERNIAQAQQQVARQTLTLVEEAKKHSAYLATIAEKIGQALGLSGWMPADGPGGNP